MNQPTALSLDILTLSSRYASGKLAPNQVLDEISTRIAAYPDEAVWINRFSRQELDEQLARAVDRKSRGIAQPLFGIPFAVKDNIDVAQHPTTAACPAFSYMARQSATVVQRLCEAGAILVGKCNLDQFATGLVGTRSPYGACHNTFDPAYISGGSSSGSAVAVAAGLVSFALGTDTAGSGRVPAGLNNIVGLKPTKGLISCAGVVPACRSLDCVSILALTCGDAARVFRIAAGPDSADPLSRNTSEITAARANIGSSFRFGVPRSEDLRFFGDSESEEIFGKTIAALSALGGERVTIDYTPFAATAALLYAGPWLAERSIAATDLLKNNPSALLPVTRTILEKGGTVDAPAVFKGFYKLAGLSRQTLIEWAKMDVMVLPTIGRAYKISEIEADPVGLNTNLGYYTNFVNLLDLCAVAIPSGFTSAGLPVGATLIAKAGSDVALIRLGDHFHRATNLAMGATGHALPVETGLGPLIQGTVQLAVVGAHLSGQPLNGQLTDRAARLVRACRTKPAYQLFALPNTTPPKPGLVRNAESGGAIEVEVWEMSIAAFGSFVSLVPPPLTIGTIELEDGALVKGFLCESHVLRSATDITSLGGWRAFLRTK